VSDYCLELGVGVMPVDRTPLDYSEQELRKKAQGRYTLEEAAREIAVNAGCNEKELLADLVKAAMADKLPVFRPGESRKCPPEEIRTFYTQAAWKDLNRWLDSDGVDNFWRFPEPDKVKRLNQENNEAAPHAKKREWHAKAWDIGKQWMVAQEKQTGTMPSVQAAATHVEREFKRLDIRGVRGDYYSAATIKREALTGLSGRPANGKKQRNPPR
jgi:hypothetical protein